MVESIEPFGELWFGMKKYKIFQKRKIKEWTIFENNIELQGFDSNDTTLYIYIYIYISLQF